MPGPTSSAYDELPYEDVAYYHTHPSNLAVVATLCGLTPPSVTNCRVLELGCGAGFNLLAMAQSLPGARLVGVDFSARQIDTGRQLACKLGVRHVELIAGDVAALDPALGTFDYIIGHGLFSWVPADIRSAILALCQRHLTPQGLAYLSYNTYPGWHLRSIIRDALRLHDPRTGSLLERVKQAREGVERMLGNLSEPTALYAQQLRQEFDALRHDSPNYLVHEYLEPNNQAFYFEDFARQASQHGLAYLAEARLETSSFVQLPEIQRQLDAFSSDLIRREQYHDYLRNRFFRQSLLCHAAVEPTRSPRRETFLQLFVRATVICLGMAEQVERFQLKDGLILSTGDPLMRAILHALHEAGPGTLRVDHLLSKVRAKLTIYGQPAGMQSEMMLLQAILRGYLDGLWLVLSYDPPFARVLSEHLRACPLVRHQAIQHNQVFNRLHRPVSVTEIDRSVLQQLDGNKPLHSLSLDGAGDQEVINTSLHYLLNAALLD